MILTLILRCDNIRLVRYIKDFHTFLSPHEKMAGAMSIGLFLYAEESAYNGGV